MTLSTVQELPNRVNTALSNATRGSSTGTDTNDPLFLDHNGEHYFYFPNSANNYATTASINPGAAATSLIIEAVFEASAGMVFGQIKTPTTGTIGLSLSATNLVAYVHNNSASGLTTDTSAVQVATDSIAAARITVSGIGGTQSVLVEGQDGFSSAAAAKAALDAGTLTDTDTFAPATDVDPNIAGEALIGLRQVSGTDVLEGIVYYGRFATDAGDIVKFDLTADIDTSADADAGQASFTATTGGTVTVNRSTSGLTTTVVTRPVMCFDGTDDYLQLPASDTPTFTATTGKYTAVLCVRFHNAPAADTSIFDTRSASANGIWLYKESSGGGGQARILLGGATTSVSSTSATAIDVDSTICVIGAVVDDGTVAVYDDNDGLSATTSTTGVGAITFASPRAATLGYTVASCGEFEMFSVLIFEDVALTEAQLSTLSTKLINGDYS